MGLKITGGIWCFHHGCILVSRDLKWKLAKILHYHCKEKKALYCIKIYSGKFSKISEIPWCLSLLLPVLYWELSQWETTQAHTSECTLISLNRIYTFNPRDGFCIWSHHYSFILKVTCSIYFTKSHGSNSSRRYF